MNAQQQYSVPLLVMMCLLLMFCLVECVWYIGHTGKMRIICLATCSLFCQSRSQMVSQSMMKMIIQVQEGLNATPWVTRLRNLYKTNSFYLIETMHFEGQKRAQSNITNWSQDQGDENKHRFQFLLQSKLHCHIGGALLGVNVHDFEHIIVLGPVGL